MPPRSDIRIQKVFTLAAPDLSDNTISGAASVMGNMDQAGDVIYPGFWTPVIDDFLQNGFVPVGHNWNDLPVAYPVLAEERGNQLYTQSVFHSTQAAQDARTVARERIDAGKSMGLSVGFMIADNGYKWFKSGNELLAHAKSTGCDMSLFDTDGIAECKGSCRALITASKLYEYSIVPAPCNTSAVADSVKGVSMPPNLKSLLRRELKGEFLGDIERDAGLDFIRSVHYALLRTIYKALYMPDDEVTTVDDLLANIPAMYDEARDLVTKTLRTLLADVDIAELAEDADYYYYYYSLPLPESDDVRFSEKAVRLETDVATFLKAASRRQEVRHKSGRKLSQDTRDKMQSILDGLTGHCDTLKTLLDNPEDGGQETDPDTTGTSQNGNDANDDKALQMAIERLSLDVALLDL